MVAISMCYLSHLCIENPCTESIALSFMLIAFYQFIKFINNNNEFRKKECLFTGMSLAVVLLIRPNLAALWVVYYTHILIRLIKQKEIKHLLQIIAWSAIGVAIIFLPVMIYLIENGVFIDCINTYLLFNFKYMNTKENGVLVVILCFIINTNYIIVGIFLIHLALIYLRRKLSVIEYEMLKTSFVCFIFTFYLAIMPQRIYLHYLIPILPTLIVPLAILLKRIDINKTITAILIGIFLLYTIVLLFRNKYLIVSTATYKEISKEVQEITDIEDNVLVLGNDTSIYLMSDRQYKGKYFYQLPVANENQDIAKEVIKEIENDLPDVIVNMIENDDKENLSYFETEIKTILSENYIEQTEKIYVKKRMK